MAGIPLQSGDRITLQLGTDPQGLLTFVKGKSWLYTRYDSPNSPLVITVKSANATDPYLSNLQIGSPVIFTSSFNGKLQQLQVQKNCSKSPFWGGVISPNNSNYLYGQWFMQPVTTSTDPNIYYGQNYAIFNQGQTSTISYLGISNVYLQSTTCCDSKGNLNYGSIDTCPASGSNGKCTTCPQNLGSSFQFFNYDGKIPTKPSNIFCCTEDPSIGSNAVGFCAEYWGSNPVCDGVMETYCKANPNDSSCTCINSNIYLAYCYDADCTNSKAYRISSWTNQTCPSGCPTIISGIVNGGINKTRIDHSNFCTNCSSAPGAQKTGFTCPQSGIPTYIWWIIGAIVVILILLGFGLLVYRKRRNNNE